MDCMSSIIPVCTTGLYLGEGDRPNVSIGESSTSGTTLVGSIDGVNGDGCGMRGGCSGYDRAESRGIERGSQLVKSSCSLVIAVSCSW